MTQKFSIAEHPALRPGWTFTGDYLAIVEEHDGPNRVVLQDTRTFVQKILYHPVEIHLIEGCFRYSYTAKNTRLARFVLWMLCR